MSAAKPRPKDNSAEPSSADLPPVDGLLVLLVGLHEPFADADEAAIHEAALQQVVDGFEEQRATLVGEAVLPEPVVFGWRERQRQKGGEGNGPHKNSLTLTRRRWNMLLLWWVY